MKNLITIACFSILLIVLVVSCKQETPRSNSETHQRQSMNELKHKIDSKENFLRQNPFVTREFSPYLNGEWIGNAVSYGPFRKGQAPGEIGPSEDEILEDLLIISKYWNLIRVYNSDPDTENILSVIQKNNIPIKVMLGVWLENEQDKPEKNQLNVTNVLKGIELANKYEDQISAVSVGNETQVFWSWHKMNIENLIRYIRIVRNNVNVPVTTADDYNFWNKPESKAVTEEVDLIVTHIYPLWNGKTLDTANEWMEETYIEIQNHHPEKYIAIGETGWATTYNPEKDGPGEQGSLIKGEVSLKAQERYLIGLNEWINENKVTTFLFEAFDEPWKGGGESTGPDEVEKHWGVFYEDRTPKESFTGFLKQTQNK